ncbi:MAG: holo-ACP synthase [Firmicutes bacterium]|nr:holo-ACP synthase [Bacillota bacterium]
MIIGIGTDIIEISRFKYPKKTFLNMIYSPAELQLFHGNNIETLAGNFAAKEAVAKALGTGFSGCSPREIEILRMPSGSPYAVLNGRARRIHEELGNGKIHISISHSKENAIAFAVLEKKEENKWNT